jgi:excinuclease UvrABC helicase subunit UvrB
MFGRKNFNFNLDELLSRYEKMMEDFHKTDWSEKSYESPDGSYKVTSYYKVFNLSDFEESKQMSKEEYFKTKLQRAIETEDFESAVKLRDQIKNLASNQEEIEKIELELKKAITEQNFESAIELRDQLKKLKS